MTNGTTTPTPVTPPTPVTIDTSAGPVSVQGTVSVQGVVSAQISNTPVPVTVVPPPTPPPPPPPPPPGGKFLPGNNVIANTVSGDRLPFIVAGVLLAEATPGTYRVATYHGIAVLIA